jgi:hypothetical protein
MIMTTFNTLLQTYVVVYCTSEACAIKDCDKYERAVNQLLS